MPISMKLVTKSIRISDRQDKMLKKLSRVSLKSEAVLFREALELLFRSPGGETKL
jgi:hypothetical protein